MRHRAEHDTDDAHSCALIAYCQDSFSLAFTFSCSRPRSNLAAAAIDRYKSDTMKQRNVDETINSVSCSLYRNIWSIGRE